MKISEINIFPIKSLGGISIEKAVVEEKGFQFDRRFMLIDENGKFLTQREHPKMAKLQPQFHGNIKIVTDEKIDNLRFPYDFSEWTEYGFGKEIEVQIWRSKCKALLANEEINNWFSKVLETNCRLVQMPSGTRRQINEDFNRGDEVVSFADGYPYLLIGENSLEKLNEKLDKKIPMNRFRPNLVVKDSEAFVEDNWKKIKIGETTFRITKPCARCVITTIDQETGISDVIEPLKTLANFRKAKDVFPDKFENLGLEKNSVLFGQNLVAENFGKTIRVGDVVEILE